MFIASHVSDEFEVVDVDVVVARSQHPARLDGGHTVVCQSVHEPDGLRAS